MSEAIVDSSSDAASGARVQLLPVFEWWDYLVYAPLCLINLSAVAGFGVCWFSAIGRGFELIPFVIVTLILAYNYAIYGFRWAMLPLMTRPAPMEPAPGLRVGVATTFVPGAEPLEMLELSLRALVGLRYPHDTWVLDEGDDDAVKELCGRLGARHFSRKHESRYRTDSGKFERGTKHGNYNAWLDAVGYERYDVIVSFDPDHVPDAGFLDASLGFLNDRRVGYVQLPQVYYNQRAGFVARGAAEETYSYYSSTQMFSYTAGFPIVTGCHNVHRKDALQAVGGFAAHDADDLLVTLIYRAAGWQGVYLPEIHAKGLTPTNYRGYLRQQLRWARSVLDVKLRAFPKLAGGMPLKTRVMSFLHGFYYVQEGLLGVVSVALLVFMLVSGVVPAFLSISVVPLFLLTGVLLTLTDLYRQRFYLDARREWGLHFRAGFLRLVKWPYIFFGLLDAASGRKRPYMLTVKVETARRGFMTWPHLVVACLVGGAYLLALLRGLPIHPLVTCAAAGTLFASLFAVFSETWRSPPPFDLELARAELGPWLEGRSNAGRPEL